MRQAAENYRTEQQNYWISKTKSQAKTNRNAWNAPPPSMVRTFNPSSRGDSVNMIAIISNDQEQIDDLCKEIKEIRRTMKHLQTQSINSDAQKAQQQVDIRAL